MKNQIARPDKSRNRSRSNMPQTRTGKDKHPYKSDDPSSNGGPNTNPTDRNTQIKLVEHVDLIQVHAAQRKITSSQRHGNAPSAAADFFVAL